MTIISFLEAFEWLWRWAKPRMEKPKELPAPMRILVVEDNATDAELFRETLKYCGREATFAENAEAAIALIRRNNIDVIFVDMRLTYMPGWDLLPLIWRHSPHSAVVVVCTLLEDLVKIPKPHKMFMVLTKPVGAEELCEVFEKLKL